MRVLLVSLAMLVLGNRELTATEGPAGGLQLMVLPTIQYAHEDIWVRTPNGRGPRFAETGKVVRGQSVHILVSAGRFGVDAAGNAEVNYRVSFVRPDGSAGAKTEELKLIPRATGRDPRFINRAVEMAVFLAGADDPLGTWRMTVDATDAISGTTVRKERPLEVCGDELLQEPLPSGTDAGRWLMNYHNRPAPQQLLAALKEFAEHPPAGAKPTLDIENGSWLGFFEQVMQDNPWLLPHVVARLSQAEGRERELLATSLAYAKRDDLSFFKTLPEPAREAFMPRRVQSWPVPPAQPLSGTQLDVLWGRFFASGSYAPLRELVGVLSYHPYAEALEAFRKNPQKPARVPEEVQKSAVFGAAVWSLRSNVQRDKLVRDYCEGILLRQELPAAEQSWLASIFKAGVQELPKDADAP